MKRNRLTIYADLYREYATRLGMSPDLLNKQATLLQSNGKELRGRLVGVNPASRKRPFVFESTTGDFWNLTPAAAAKIVLK